MKKPHSTSQSGFTLLELLLVIGVAAILMLGVGKIMQGWADNEVASAGGQQLERVSSIVQKYVEANWTTLTDTADAVSAGGEWDNLRIALEEEGLLRSGVIRSPLKVDFRIAYRVDGNARRATVYATTPILAQKALYAARQTGSAGGTVGTFPVNGNATGAFGQWSVASSQLVPGGFPCTFNSNQSCLVAVVSYSNDSLCGGYLYRDDVETSGVCPGGNTMNTDLKMNDNSITDVSELTTENLNVNTMANLGETNVTGTATFNGPTVVSGGMQVNNGMTVSGDASFANNVTMDSGTLNVTDLNANTVQAPRIETNEMNVQNLTMNGNLAVDDNITINGNVDVAPPGGEIYVNTLNAGAINANGGELVVGKLDVQNTMDINGTVNITGGTLIVDRLVAKQCVEVNDGSGAYEKYGLCP